MVNTEELYVFGNRRNNRYYSFQQVKIIIKRYKKPSLLVGGELKEKLYKELLDKQKLRKGLIFHGLKQAYQLVDFNYSNWEKGAWLKDEVLTIELEYSRIHTEKMNKDD